MKTPSSRVSIAAGAGARRGALLALLVVASMTAAACAAGATSAPSPSPSPSEEPATLPPGALIDHPTAPTDVVFRFEEGGGFVPVGFFATEAPIFTLYGDGTVIFKDGNAAPPPPEPDGIIRTPPYRTIRLSEIEIQAFLRSAIEDGGLGVAKDWYESPGADLPTATFTITAGGITKSVSVMALGMDRGDAQEPPVLKALAGLGDRIRDFGREVDGETTWVPDRWRGILTPDSLNPPQAWPWPSVTPADFVEHPDPEAPRFPVRTMSPDEIAALKLESIDGGFSSLSLAGPNGRTYLFALRPLFPDEAF
jgi:hypothetical protein